DKVWHYCDSTGVRGRTVTLKVKFSDFQIITRSRSRVTLISDRSTLASISAELLAAQFPLRKGVRLIGVSLSSLCAESSEVDPQWAVAFDVDNPPTSSQCWKHPVIITRRYFNVLAATLQHSHLQQQVISAHAESVFAESRKTASVHEIDRRPQ